MRSLLMGGSRPASSIAAARLNEVTSTEASPKRSTARRIWRVRLVVFPVPSYGGPKMRNPASLRPHPPRWTVSGRRWRGRKQCQRYRIVVPHQSSAAVIFPIHPKSRAVGAPLPAHPIIKMETPARNALPAAKLPGSL
jgi:hypothetical protein